MPAPTRVGRYEIVRRLGQGGMGVVYLAKDPLLQRTVAIKLLATDLENAEDGAEMRERFSREARSVASLRHQHIVTIFDIGEQEGHPFIAMEYLDGETISEMIKRRAEITLKRKLEIVLELCSGLGYAHRNGVIHRDIKPANLMHTTEGGIKILDFGLARLATELHNSGLTQAGTLMGTPHYMSPEQIDGNIQVDQRADIFAVGAVLFELLTYRKAFTGETPTIVLHNILHTTPPAPSQLVPILDPGLDRIVAQAIERDRDRRYANLGLMANDIATVLGSQAQAALDATVVQSGRPGGPGRPTPSGQIGGTGSASGSERRTGSESPIPNLDKLAKKRAGQIEAHLKAAETYLAAGDQEAAIEACEKVILLDPQNTRALRMLQETSQRSEEDEQIQQWLVEARGRLASGALPEAEALIAQALNLRPGLADAQRLQQQCDAARDRAIRSALERARASLASGDAHAAARSANEALDYEPMHPEASEIRLQAIELLQRRREEEERRQQELDEAERRLEEARLARQREAEEEARRRQEEERARAAAALAERRRLEEAARRKQEQQEQEEARLAHEREVERVRLEREEAERRRIAAELEVKRLEEQRRRQLEEERAKAEAAMAARKRQEEEAARRKQEEEDARRRREREEEARLAREREAERQARERDAERARIEREEARRREEAREESVDVEGAQAPADVRPWHKKPALVGGVAAAAIVVAAVGSWLAFKGRTGPSTGDEAALSLLVDEAQTSYKAGDVLEAVASALAGLKIRADHAPLTSLLAGIRTDAANAANAARERAVSAKATDTPEFIAAEQGRDRANTLVALEDTARAVTEYSAAKAGYGNAASSMLPVADLVQLAQRAVTEQRLRTAVGYAEQVLAKDRSNRPALQLLATIRDNARRAAVAAQTSAVQKRANNQSMFATGRRMLAQADALGDTDRRRQLTLLEEAAKAFDDARLAQESADSAVAADSNSARELEQQARRSLAAGNLTQALNEVNRSLQLTDSPEARRTKGDIENAIKKADDDTAASAVASRRKSVTDLIDQAARSPERAVELLQNAVALAAEFPDLKTTVDTELARARAPRPTPAGGTAGRGAGDNANTSGGTAPPVKSRAELEREAREAIDEVVATYVNARRDGKFDALVAVGASSFQSDIRALKTFRDNMRDYKLTQTPHGPAQISADLLAATVDFTLVEELEPRTGNKARNTLRVVMTLAKENARWVIRATKFTLVRSPVP